MMTRPAGSLPNGLKLDFLRSFSSSLSLTAAALIWSAPTLRAQGMDELYEKAKLEKSVALIAAGPSEPYEHWIREFQQRYPGVRVSFTGGLSNGLNRNINQQIANQKMESDLAIFQTIQDFVRWETGGCALVIPARGVAGDRSRLQG